MATDIIEYPNRVRDVPFTRCNQVVAVSKFGPWCNILLLISPLPYGYGDYYAYYDFIASCKEGTQTKFIVFVGELGASTGSPGTYKYLMEHPRLELMHREMVQNTPQLEREIFIFRIITFHSIY
jgi:hypothetical protein